MNDGDLDMALLQVLSRLSGGERLRALAGLTQSAGDAEVRQLKMFSRVNRVRIWRKSDIEAGN
jgi:hypothetical protein